MTEREENNANVVLLTIGSAIMGYNMCLMAYQVELTYMNYAIMIVSALILANALKGLWQKEK